MYAHVRPSKSDDSAQYCAMSDIKHVLCLPPLSFSRAGAFFFFFFFLLESLRVECFTWITYFNE